MRRASTYLLALSLTLWPSAETATATDTRPWYLVTLDDIDVGYYVHHGDTAVAIDQNRKIHISYRGPSRVLKYATNASGVWTTETVFSAPAPVARENAIAVDSSGLPHISFSYSDGSAEDLLYATKLPDGGWEVTTVITTNSAGMENDIALDSQEAVHISHWQWNGSDLLYSTNRGGEWSTETLDDAHWSRTAIAIDSSDASHFVYRNAGGLIHRSGPTVTTIDSGSFMHNHPSMAIDSNDRLHLSYTHGYDLKYATDASGSWETGVVAPSVRAERDHSIALDTRGFVHIVYRDQDTGSLRHATNESGPWTLETVDGPGEIGHSSSIAVDGAERVVITYRHQNVPTSPFYDVWGTSTSNFFVVGDGSAVVHYDAGELSRIDPEAAAGLRGIWGSSAADVLVVGSYGTILHHDGNVWTTMASGTSKQLHGIWGSSGRNIFAVGDDGVILRYDGSEWTALESNVGEDLNAIWGSSDADIFIAGDDGTILHYDGISWSRMESGTNRDLRAVWGASPSRVFAAGAYGTILHYDGNAWAPATSGTTRNLWDIAGRSSRDVFAVGDYGTVVHYDGEGWSKMDSGISEFLSGVWSRPGSDVFAAGYHQILRYDGTSWRFVAKTTLRYATTDLCEGDDDAGDADGDVICDDLDICWGDDATGDSDIDGFCDHLDRCPGHDDGLDADADEVPNGCDLCQGDDSTGDFDGDGLCLDTDCDDNDPSPIPRDDCGVCGGDDSSCGLFSDGFESGDTAAWSQFPPTGV